MSFLNWTDEMSVNVKEIDNQHKKMIKIINKLYNAMEKRKPRDVLENVLDELIEYADIHFGTEEKYFEKFGYTKKKEHRKEHKDFVVKVLDFRKGYREGRLLLSADIMEFLKDWLKTHIMGSDKKYSKLFNKNGLY